MDCQSFQAAAVATALHPRQPLALHLRCSLLLQRSRKTRAAAALCS